MVRAIFIGLGSDGTVSANKNSIKIIGENTANYAQGYFYYDSKKSGTMTTSYLRFGPNPIRSPYAITKASFVACHQPVFLERYDMLAPLMTGGNVPAEHAVRRGRSLGSPATPDAGTVDRQARPGCRD